MATSTTIHLLITYRYSLLVPFAFFEGHIISIIVGFLSRLGYFNPFLGAVLVVIGNLLGDITLYWLGYYKGEKIAQSWGKYIGITAESIEKARSIFHTHKNKILFISKITNGFGLAMAVLFTAGMTRIPFKTYMFWNSIGECIWTGTLVALGYFFGHIYETVSTVTWRIGIIFVSGIIILIFFRARSYFKNKINP